MERLGELPEGGRVLELLDELLESGRPGSCKLLASLLEGGSSGDGWNQDGGGEIHWNLGVLELLGELLEGDAVLELFGEPLEGGRALLLHGELLQGGKVSCLSRCWWAEVGEAGGIRTEQGRLGGNLGVGVAWRAAGGREGVRWSFLASCWRAGGQVSCLFRCWRAAVEGGVMKTLEKEVVLWLQKPKQKRAVFRKERKSGITRSLHRWAQTKPSRPRCSLILLRFCTKTYNRRL